MEEDGIAEGVFPVSSLKGVFLISGKVERDQIEDGEVMVANNFILWNMSYSILPRATMQILAQCGFMSLSLLAAKQNIFGIY